MDITVPLAMIGSGISPGSVPIGSIYTNVTDIAFSKRWIKIGPLDTDWMELNDSSVPERHVNWSKCIVEEGSLYIDGVEVV